MNQNIPMVLHSDEKINRIQQNIIPPLNDLMKAPFLTGNLLERVSLNLGNNDIPHKLGREYLGYFVLLSNSSAAIYDNPTLSTDLTKFLRLNSSASAVVTLWVF